MQVRIKYLAIILAVMLAEGLVLPAQPNTPATNAPAPFKAGADFHLSPADRLAFMIEDDPVKGAEPDLVSVNALGQASFRVTRGSDMTITLDVKGKTLAEVVAMLKAKLDADYYNDAQVKLELKETTARFGQVLFIGRGTRGNMLQLMVGEEKRIFEAVYQVGVNEWANLKKVKLMRVDPETQKTEMKIIDLEEIKKGNRANNVILRSGDIIDVPERMFNFGD
jgi:protein involved in polysaccharide export with SLBB domain